MKGISSSQRILQQSIKRPKAAPVLLTDKEKCVLAFILKSVMQDANYFDMCIPKHMRSENEARLTIGRMKRLTSKNAGAAELTDKERYTLRLIFDNINNEPDFFVDMLKAKGYEAKTEIDARATLTRLNKLLRPNI